MRADLHLHSIYSDGKYSPGELIAMAKDAGVSAVSVTDHDAMGGQEEAVRAARACGVTYIPGWEVSAYEGPAKVHILGYGCEPNAAYEAFLRERCEGGRIRARSMMEKANAFFGLDVTMDDIEGYHVKKQSPLHTMHVVSAFADRLHRDRGELYRAAFARGGVAFSEECRPAPDAAIDIIHATHGVAVLAHPGRIRMLDEMQTAEYRATADPARRAVLDKISEAGRAVLMDRLAARGLDGIECYYTTHTAIETEFFVAFARRYGLLVTGGSDFHDETGENVIGLPVFDAGEALLSKLRGMGAK